MKITEKELKPFYSWIPERMYELQRSYKRNEGRSGSDSHILQTKGGW